MPRPLFALVFALGFAAASVGDEAPREIPLWPEGVPGEKVPVDPPERVEQGADGIRRRFHVSAPRLVAQPLPRLPGKDRAAVIVLPGGGYSILADDHEGDEIGRFLGGHGIVTFTLLYRVPTAAFADPDAGPVADAKRAVSIVRQRAAEYGIDPARIGIMGFSAGGHTALLAATTPSPEEEKDGEASSRPDCTILVYPWRVAAADGASLWPGVVIDSETPPTFVAQTTDDKASPAEGSMILVSRLLRAGVPTEFHLYQSGGHGYGLRRREGSPGTADWPHRLVEWLETRGYTTP